MFGTHNLLHAVMHRSLTICVQYSISSKMGVVHFRPQHFCLGPCRVDRFNLSNTCINCICTRFECCVYVYLQRHQLIDCCLTHLSNKFVLRNPTCQHYLSPRAAPFQRHSSGTVHIQKMADWSRDRDG